MPVTSDYADRQQALIKRAALLQASLPVLDGGSVNPGSAAELIACPHVDRLCIGRSPWAVKGYIDILRLASAAI